MPYTATHKYARISPRKVRALADLVRGKFADEALDILRFQPHRGARMLEKVIKSALGNAENKQAPALDDLVVVDAVPAGDNRDALLAALKTVRDTCPRCPVMLMSIDMATGKVAVACAVPDAGIA